MSASIEVHNNGQAQLESLAEVESRCALVEQWAATRESVAEVKDAADKLAAINEYLSRTSTEGRARVAASLRRLECRIGQLLGDAEQIPGPGRGNHKRVLREEAFSLVGRTQRHEFRQMAANITIVEQVIAEAGERPASRRMILDAIKAAIAEDAPEVNDARRWIPAETRASQIEVLAAGGHRATQIAEALGIGVERVRALARNHGIVLPDAQIGRVRRIDSTRVLEQTVLAVGAASAGIDLIDLSKVDPARTDEWATSLNDSLAPLKKLAKTLKEMADDQA